MRKNEYILDVDWQINQSRKQKMSSSQLQRDARHGIFSNQRQLGRRRPCVICTLEALEQEGHELEEASSGYKDSVWKKIRSIYTKHSKWKGAGPFTSCQGGVRQCQMRQSILTGSSGRKGNESELFWRSTSEINFWDGKICFGSLFQMFQPMAAQPYCFWWNRRPCEDCVVEETDHLR